MKLQPASRKEIKRISIGTLIMDVLMIAALFLLSQFGIGTFAFVKILYSAAIGSVIAILNFTILCLTVQKAVEIEDRKQMQARFQLSYNARMVIQAAWVVASFLIPQIHFIAGAAPVLFPKVTILYLNARGKITDPPREKTDAGEAIAEGAETSELPENGGMDVETTQEETAPSDETEA